MTEQESPKQPYKGVSRRRFLYGVAALTGAAVTVGIGVLSENEEEPNIAETPRKLEPHEKFDSDMARIFNTLPSYEGTLDESEMYTSRHFTYNLVTYTFLYWKDDAKETKIINIVNDNIPENELKEHLRLYHITPKEVSQEQMCNCDPHFITLNPEELEKLSAEIQTAFDEWRKTAPPYPGLPTV